jgi:hypothetical protein
MELLLKVTWSVKVNAKGSCVARALLKVVKSAIVVV